MNFLNKTALLGNVISFPPAKRGDTIFIQKKESAQAKRERELKNHARRVAGLSPVPSGSGDYALKDHPKKQGGKWVIKIPIPKGILEVSYNESTKVWEY